MEQIITNAREYMDYKQKHFAKLLDCSISRISCIEGGENEYKPEEIPVLRKYLGIEDVPVFEEERGSFESSIYAWRDMIHEGRIEEAREKRLKLAPIVRITHEEEFILLYRMYEASYLLFCEDDTVEARKIIELVRPSVKGTSNNIEYLFHYYSGSLNFQEGNFRVALQNYLTAYDLGDKDRKAEFSINYSIAFCYSKLGMSIQAIAQLKEISHQYADDKSSIRGMRVFTLLSFNYICINNSEKAKELAEKSLAIAEGVGNGFFIGLNLHNLGCLYLKKKDCEKSMNYFEKASEYLKEYKQESFENLYYKVLCMGAMKDKAAKDHILSAIASAQNDDHYTILFNSALRLLSISSDESSQYIKEVTIPHLLKTNGNFKALMYCEELENQYKKDKLKIKAMEVGTIARDIYRIIIEGDE